MKQRTKGVMILMIFMAGASQAQISVPFTWGHPWGVGARAVAMGGAYTAVANDYAATFYNPAGLGRIKSFEFSGSLSHLTVSTESTFLGAKNEENSTYTKLNDIGVAVPVPTTRGSLVFSFGYHQLRDFDNFLYSEAFLSSAGDSVTQSYSSMENGEFSSISFGAAVETAPNFFLGGAVNVWSGENDYTREFREADEPYDIWTFSDTTSTDHVLTKFSGFQATLSALYSYRDIVMVGAKIVSPVLLTAKENWDYLDNLTFDDGSWEEAADDGFWRYKIRSQWIYSGGAALHIGPVLLSGDLSYSDYSQMSYRDEPPEDMTQAEANFIIKDSFRSALDYRFGGEIAIPFTGFKIRGGYAMVASPLKQEAGLEELPLGKNRHVYSGGVGVTFAERFTVDLAGAYTTWEGTATDVIGYERREMIKVLGTLTYRM